MNQEELRNLWLVVDTTRPADSELYVHKVGIRSAGSDLCIGVDKQARRHLLVPLPLGQTVAPTFRSSGLFVKTRALLRDNRETSYLDLICLNPVLNEVFSNLVLDVLEPMSEDEPAAIDTCLRVLDEWKELFGSRSPGLGKDQIIGLVGELIILDRLTAISASALARWDGPTGGVHDFRCGRRALEVKTSMRRHGRFFSIAGHQQLEPPAGGDLHLAALRLESNAGGYFSIPLLIEKIRNHGADYSSLLSRLRELGYAPNSSEEADSIRFDLSECRFYEVDDDFPRIIARSFVDGQLPSGVVRIAYEIDLSADSPAPLDASNAELLLREFALGT